VFAASRRATRNSSGRVGAAKLVTVCETSVNVRAVHVRARSYMSWAGHDTIRIERARERAERHPGRIALSPVHASPARLTERAQYRDRLARSARESAASRRRRRLGPSNRITQLLTIVVGAWRPALHGRAAHSQRQPPASARYAQGKAALAVLGSAPSGRPGGFPSESRRPPGTRRGGGGGGPSESGARVLPLLAVAGGETGRGRNRGRCRRPVSRVPLHCHFRHVEVEAWLAGELAGVRWRYGRAIARPTNRNFGSGFREPMQATAY
jgi:hypothetical protein